ncbi:POK18 protein, partial [Piprites chloris]|nr:POK18 protein [Piprites chloris]
MGSLQPGFPNPSMIAEGWSLLTVDLKDCFITVSLHEDDKQPPLSPSCWAQEAHAIFHQNARGMRVAYVVPLEEVRAIVKACPICSHHN